MKERWNLKNGIADYMFIAVIFLLMFVLPIAMSMAIISKEDQAQTASKQAYIEGRKQGHAEGRQELLKEIKNMVHNTDFSACIREKIKE